MNEAPKLLIFRQKTAKKDKWKMVEKDQEINPTCKVGMGLKIINLNPKQWQN